MSLCRTLMLLLCLALAGCQPGSMGQSDEQKDPYFLAGKNNLQKRDYQAAIDMFEKALDVNPRSASAHFELGVLYEQQRSDYGAALYHYERSMMWNSNAPFTELARQRVQECKRELAKTVTQPVTMQHMQRELETLRAENESLKYQLSEWRKFYAARGVTFSNVTANSGQPMARPVLSNTAVVSPPADSLPRVDANPRNGSTPIRAAPTGTTRSHTVTSGDTLERIARRYGVKVSALQAANPSVDARRLRPGQTLAVPPP